MSEEAVDPKSKYAKLAMPEFKSTVPAHLIDRLTPQEKYVVETLSRMEQQNAWLMNAAMEANRVNLETDVRVQNMEAWRKTLSGKWAILGLVGGMLATAIISALVKSIIELIFK
jgi:hypothetical protein